MSVKNGRNTYSFLRRSRLYQDAILSLLRKLSQYLFLLTKVKTQLINPSIPCWDPSVAIPIPSYEGQDASTAFMSIVYNNNVAIPIPSYEGQDIAFPGYPIILIIPSQYLFLLTKVKTSGTFTSKK